MEITERHETQMAPFSAGVDLLASHSSHNAFVVPFDAKLKQLAIHTTHEILKEEIDARCAALVHSFNLYRKGKTS